MAAVALQHLLCEATKFLTPMGNMLGKSPHFCQRKVNWIIKSAADTRLHWLMAGNSNGCVGRSEAAQQRQRQRCHCKRHCKRAPNEKGEGKGEGNCRPDLHIGV